LSKRGLRKVAVATFVGTAMEWYDYFLFGLAASLVFNRLYFTALSPAAAALAAFATFGVGFAARPFGAVLFGWIGDRVGRKPALIMTVTLIGLATGSIGLLPAFATIGVAAPALLVLLRLTQGVAVGGEWGGAVTLAVEHAPADRRGWYSTLPQLGSPVGALLSSGAFALVLRLPAQQFDAWGWRLPFLAAFPLLIIALYIRRAMAESPVFEREVAKVAETTTLPALEVFRQAPRAMAIATSAALLGIGGYYMLTTFTIGYGVRVLGLPSELLVDATLAGSVVELFVILAAARVADRIQPASLTCLGAIACALLAFPVFHWLASREPTLVYVAIAVGTATVAAVYAVSGGLLTQLFPAHLRYSGVALAYNLAGVLAGFLPFIATALTDASGNAVWAPASVLVVVASITALGGFLSGRMQRSCATDVRAVIGPDTRGPHRS
jgi:MFS family permease